MMMILNICYKITINNGNDGGGGYGCGDDAVDYKDNGEDEDNGDNCDNGGDADNYDEEFFKA